MMTTTDFTERLWIKVIDWASLPVWFYIWLKRHRTIRTALILFLMGSFAVIYFFGIMIYVTLWTYFFRLIFVVMFIIIQFAAMFWFLSSGKNIETEPGDKGLINFDDDYYGNVNEVELVRHWTSLLTMDRSKLDDMGAKTISGILLSGPPGVGKTMMARCLATASNAAFLALSATDLQAMFIGIGPMKVMRLVSKARKKAKQFGASIIFIDEIDAIGGSRGMVEGDRGMFERQKRGVVEKMIMGAGMGGGGLGVLSRLLTEMDGVTEIRLRDEIINKMRKAVGIAPIEQGVVLFMAATNRPMVLDSALTRPGRFDREIKIGMPDAVTRQALFDGYLKKVKHEEGIDVDMLVDITGGVSHAFIASSIEKDAPRIAIFDGRSEISQLDIMQAIEERVVGIPNPIENLDPEQERQIAIHEAGHAVMAWLVRPERRIANVSIVRRGSGILGYVRDVEKKELYAQPLARISANIMVSLAGHEAVKMIFGEYWTGASSDFQHIRMYVRYLREHGQFDMVEMLTDAPSMLMWGQPEGPRQVGQTEKQYILSVIEATQQKLAENETRLLAVADALVEKKELSSDEAYAILERDYDDQSAE